jgi:hypothetical protein
MKKILKSKLNAGNIIKAINSRAISIIRYGAGLIEWTKEELKEMDRKTRKILTIYKCFHPRDDVNRLYWKRVEAGGRLQSEEDVVEIEKCSLGHYLTKAYEEFLKEVKIENIFKEEEDPKERKKTIINRRKESFLEKKIHPVFWKGTKEIRDEEATWQWLRKGTLKKETEGMILAAQNQALRTKWMRHHIDKEFEISPTCRICGLADETISHIVSECTPLAQKDYKNVRHDKIAAAAIHLYLYVRSIDLNMQKKAITTTFTRKAEYWRTMK